MVDAGLARLRLDVPITSMLDGERDTGVPDMVIALPPGDRDVWPIWKPDGFAVKVSPPALKMLGAFGVGIGVTRLRLDVPMTSMLDGESDTDVPEMVIALPPGKRDVPPISKPDGFAVKV